jgi:hypothetical protein
MLVKIVLKRKGNVKDTFLNWLRTPFSQRKIRNHIFQILQDFLYVFMVATFSNTDKMQF